MPISNTVWTVLGIVATVAVGAAVASSSTAAAATPPAPGVNQPNFPVLVGHRYSVTIASSAAIGAPLAVSEVLAAFPGAVDADTTQAAPAGATMNVLSAGNPTLTTCNYVFDLFVAPTNPPGQLTAAQLAAPYASRAPAGASLTVTVADQGITPPYGQPVSSWTRATTINPGDQVRAAVDASDFQTIAAAAGVPLTGAGWAAFFTAPIVAAALAPSALLTFAPGASLPVDWPADDPAPASEYHAQFVYGGSVALPVGMSPLVGATVWTRPAPSIRNLPPVATSPAGTVTAPGATTQPTSPGAPQTIVLPPSNAPLTVHIGQGTIGAQLTIALQGGGTFTAVNSLDGAGSTAVQTPGWPMTSTGYPQPLPMLPWFVYTTPTYAGELEVTWTDPQGLSHTNVVTYGP